MAVILVISALVLFMCVFAEKFSDRVGMPALIMFMFIGMLFGCDGIVKIPFDNFKQAENICTMALIFIMFYGGFNTKWEAAKNVSIRALTMSTVGVVLTALITTAICYVFLPFTIEESFLIGAVLSSTDAASVFAILRKKKLNLRDGAASLLEVESGSNDPISYLLTIIAICTINNESAGNIAITIVLQIVVGTMIGIAISILSRFVLIKTKLVSEGLDTIFLIAMILICCGSSSLLGGNAYLSVYLFGILVGNSKISNKKALIPFFDGVTSLAQIVIFFLIGLLSFPHEMPRIIPSAISIAIIITLVARPVAVLVLLKPLKCNLRYCLLVAWAGVRGASSSVFAIMAVAAGVSMKQDLFHIVFTVTLISVAIQGTLLHKVANKLYMIDNNSDVRKTFNDYQEETSLQLMRMHISEGHEWVDKKIKDVNLPTDSLALMIKRGKETIITKGDTKIHAGDNLILNIPPYTTKGKENLVERQISKEDKWCGKAIGRLRLAKNELIAMVIRGEESIIPDGKTVLLENDIVVLYQEGGEPIEGVLQ